MTVVYLGENKQPDEGTGRTDTKIVSKFVIISTQDELRFVYGPLEEFAYHAGLVKKYCELNDIPAGWVKKPDVYEIYDGDYAVEGGGWMEQDPAAKQLKIYGYSTAYGGFNPEDIPYLLQDHPELSGYEIGFEP